MVRLQQSEIDKIVSQVGEIESIYPLTGTQAGMLFHSDYLQKDAGVYCEQLLLEILNSCSPKHLLEAWQRTAQQHAALRTVILHHSRVEPLQVVKRNVAVELEECDWSDEDYTEELLWEKLQALLDCDRAKSHKLDEGAWRLILIG